VTVLVDYSQLVVASCLAFGSDMDKGKNPEKAIDIIRHATISSLLSYKQKYSKQYGNIILCADGSNNWRKTYYPYYKQHRKGAREESKTDWKLIFNFATELLEDLRNVFPFGVVRVDEAEGDDVIAVLTKYITETETVQEGLIEVAPPILIVSSDGDYKQLHKHRNVRQWNPIMKKFVAKPEPDFIFEKILTGDKGDGVPNVFAPDDWFVNGEGRQKSITAKVIERFRSGQITEQERRNFQRNQTLVDFDYIPQEVQQDIIQTYKVNTPARDLNAIMKYFIAHRMRLLLDNIQEFKVWK
jgi:5'-3' exonuclease